MFNLTPAQQKVIASIDLRNDDDISATDLNFQAVGNDGAVTAYSDETDLYIDRNGTGVIEYYIHGEGYYYFNLNWEPLDHDEARDLINSMT